jgi:hypothetical protein
MINNTFNPSFEADNVVSYSLGSSEKTFHEKTFSTSRYLCYLTLLEGHGKIEGKHSFPKVNPTKRDFSRLVNLLNESGLRLN